MVRGMWQATTPSMTGYPVLGDSRRSPHVRSWLCAGCLLMLLLDAGHATLVQKYLVHILSLSLEPTGISLWHSASQVGFQKPWHCSRPLPYVFLGPMHSRVYRGHETISDGCWCQPGVCCNSLSLFVSGPRGRCPATLFCCASLTLVRSGSALSARRNPASRASGHVASRLAPSSTP